MKKNTYRIYYTDTNGERCDEYVIAYTAQEAVDYVRNTLGGLRCIVIDVAKIVNNWK